MDSIDGMATRIIKIYQAVLSQVLSQGFKPRHGVDKMVSNEGGPKRAPKPVPKMAPRVVWGAFWGSLGAAPA